MCCLIQDEMLDQQVHRISAGVLSIADHERCGRMSHCLCIIADNFWKKSPRFRDITVQEVCLSLHLPGFRCLTTELVLQCIFGFNGLGKCDEKPPRSLSVLSVHSALKYWGGKIAGSYSHCYKNPLQGEESSSFLRGIAVISVMENIIC